MKEEKDIASMENNKGYWNESYCYISESGYEIYNILKCLLAHCLVQQSYKRFVETFPTHVPKVHSLFELYYLHCLVQVLMNENWKIELKTENWTLKLKSWKLIQKIKFK